MTEFPKYPKIKRLNHKSNKGILQRGDIAVKEKMDGANFRFTWWPEEERILFGSRNIIWKNEKDTDKNFLHAVEYVRENIDKQELKRLNDEHDGIVIYVEAMHSHHIEYDWDNTPSVLGFDIWQDIEHGSPWWEWEKVKETLENLNLPHVPEFYYGTAEDYSIGEDYEFPESEYHAGLPEGIVVANDDTGQKAKYRTPEFREVHQGLNPNKAESRELTDSEKLAFKYATEARIIKWIHKLNDRGHDIEMQMMPELWKAVAEDIIDEEGEEILLGNYDINTKEFRSEIASECARVLKQYLSRPEDSVLNERQE